MKICFLTYNLSTKDGGGRFSHDLVLDLKRSGFEVLTFTNYDFLKNPFLNFFKIRKMLRNSDIIHAIDIWPNGFYARLISFGLKKPIIITALGTYSVAPFYSWRRSLMKFTSRNTQIVSISDYTKKKILETMPNLSIKVICPSFSLDFWTGGMADESGALKFRPYILSVGALKPRKGYINSIKAFSVAANELKNLNYIIVSQNEDYNYAKKLKNLVKENNLENRIFFMNLGVDDSRLLGFYRNAELFVLTPVEENHHFEGFGIVYLEAAASGLPIVASKNSGAESAVKEDYNGILVPQNNPKTAAAAILKILKNSKIRNKFSNHSCEWVKNFNLTKQVEDYISIYNDKIKHD